MPAPKTFCIVRTLFDAQRFLLLRLRLYELTPICKLLSALNVAGKIYTRNCEITPELAFPVNMQRIALRVEYRGDKYKGIQRQASSTETVQRYLHEALSFVADEEITTQCAGRTDAGVHASSQWCHFDTLAVRDNKAWTKGVNSRLPRTIRVHYAKEVSPQFHARFCASSRSYRYVLRRCDIASAVLHGLVAYLPYDVDIQTMNQAASALLGEHDFSAFRSSGCQAASPIRTLKKLDVRASGDFVYIDVEANAFLYNMVRNIVGSLLEVGRGVQPVSWMEALLIGRDRSSAAAKAPACGLYFVGVQYPPEFGLPLGPYFPPLS